VHDILSLVENVEEQREEAGLMPEGSVM